MRRETRLGPAQLEILHYVQNHAPATVREVADHFAAAKGTARTTVLTVMEKLREKGYLTRRKSGGVYRYTPRVAKTQVLQSLAHDFIERALEGSLAPLIAYLTQRAEMTDEELGELKQLIRELDARRKTRGAEDRRSRIDDR